MRFHVFVCVWLLLLLVQELVFAVDSTRVVYPLQCTLDWQHVVVLALDAESSSRDYRVVQVIDSFATLNNDRNLRSSQQEEQEQQQQLDERISRVITGVSEDAILARRCSCSDEFDGMQDDKEEDKPNNATTDDTLETHYVYCPLAASMCTGTKTTSADNANIECFSDTRTTTNKVNVVFWSTLVSVAGLAGLLVFTRFGWHVLGRFASFFWTGFNDRVVTYMLQRNPDRARAMTSLSQNNAAATTRSQASTQSTTTGERREPMRLLLRTQIYAPDETFCKNTSQNAAPATDDESNDDDDDDDDVKSHECSICFVKLQAGDKVGNLACSHKFRESYFTIIWPRMEDGDLML
jgi:hypothetical protein